MRIFSDFDQLVTIPDPVLTIGTFDGVHLGHQRIISRLNEEAQKIGGESVLFSFFPHPRMVLYPDSHGLKLIQTQEEKLDKLERCGLQNAIIYPFTKSFSRLTATEFVRDFLVNKLHVRKLVIGYDHQFGRNREGGIAFLRDICDTYGFEVIEIPVKEIDDMNISSTKIRNALLEGEIETANRYLGEPFELNGKVVSGERIGRKIGFPTANLDLQTDLKLIPKSGVYCVRVKLEDDLERFGMMNIGNRPTVIDEPGNETIEVHIFDFDKDLYNNPISVQLLSRVRDELKFNSLDELKVQLYNDEQNIRALLADL